MSICRYNVDRKVILEHAFPICFHAFSRKRDDNTIGEHVDKDDHHKHILASEDRAEERAESCHREGW